MPLAFCSWIWPGKIPGTHIACYRDRYQAFKHGEQRIQQRLFLFFITNNKEKFSSGSVTVYAGKIKSLSGHLRSWTEAWIGQAPTEKSWFRVNETTGHRF